LRRRIVVYHHVARRDRQIAERLSDGRLDTGVLHKILHVPPEPLQALLAGVYLHGAAADALAASGTGPIGVTASEVIDRARALLNRRS